MTATFQKDVLTFVTLKYSGGFAPLLEIKPRFFTCYATALPLGYPSLCFVETGSYYAAETALNLL